MTAAEVAPVVRQITQANIDAYADASGDHNPIHIDVEFAKTTPMGGTIAHGMLVVSLISEMMTAAFDEAWLTTGTLDVRFRNPARPGDRVEAQARATGADGGRLRYAVQCLSQGGEILISGTAEVTPT